MILYTFAVHNRTETEEREEEIFAMSVMEHTWKNVIPWEKQTPTKYVEVNQNLYKLLYKGELSGLTLYYAEWQTYFYLIVMAKNGLVLIENDELINKLQKYIIEKVDEQEYVIEKVDEQEYVIEKFDKQNTGKIGSISKLKEEFDEYAYHAYMSR